MTRINHLGNFTSYVWLESEIVPANWSGGHWTMPPPPSTPHIQPVEGAGSTQEGNKNVVLDRPLQQTDMDVQRFSLKLGVTGFPSLADTKRLCLQSTGAA